MHLHQQAKSRASNLHSTNGGAAHGHLGAVIQPISYAFVSNVPYVIPVYPPALDIPVNATRHHTDFLKAEHATALWEYHEYYNLTHKFIAMLQQAIEPAYLRAITSRVAGTITLTFLEAIQRLKQAYGNVSEEQLAELELETKHFAFDPTLPIDNVYNAIEDLVEYADLAEVPYTQRQIVAIGHGIVNRTRILVRRYVNGTAGL